MIQAINPSHKVTIIEHIRSCWASGCVCKVCRSVDQKQPIKLKG